MSCRLPRVLVAGLGLLVASNERPQQETRDQVYEQVKAYPGLHLSEIARQVGVPTNHAKYHLRRLERDGWVSSLKQDGYWRFFPRVDGSTGARDVIAPSDKRLLGLLRRPKPLHVALHLLSAGEATHGELAEVLGVAGSTAHHHLQRMEEAGLLIRRRHGRRVYYRLTTPEQVAEMIERYEPPDELVAGFLDAWESLEL